MPHLDAAAVSAIESAASVPEVCINGRFLGQRTTGVQRYARETIHALDRLLAKSGGAGLRWTVLVPRGTPIPAFCHLSAETLGHLQGHWWEQTELAWRTRNRLLFSFGFTGPLLKRRQIITVHDAAVVRMPQSFTAGFRHAYRHLVRRIAARAPRTMSVSQFSASEAVACFAAPAERVRVTTEGWQHLQRIGADERLIDRHGLRGQPYALAVSSPTPSKNFAVIERALALLGPDAPRCVVVGAADPGVFRETRAAASLLHVGYVSDPQLKALYAHATGFIFPSLYEGFGIPPLEAMASGCPVIASTAPALREVCADAALYFDPTQPGELAAQLRRLFADPALREHLRSAGVRRLEHFSWERAAALNLAAIQEVAGP